MISTDEEVAVLGAGPAGLMAAEVLAQGGAENGNLSVSRNHGLSLDRPSANK